MICTCDACKYIFASKDMDARCPDCGRFAVRPATADEVAEYEQRQEENEEW